MKFPTIKEMAEEVAEKALDEFEYKGKTLREWVKIILATDTNVATKVGTNLAEVGTDCISRQAAIDKIVETSDEIYKIKQKGATYPHDDFFQGMAYAENIVKQLPPAQPERIKGHWIEIALSNHTYKCSVCGRLLVNITDGKNNVAKNYPYCHCGADMRGEQDE